MEAVETKDAILAIAKETERTKGRLIVIQAALTFLFNRASPSALDDLSQYIMKYESESTRSGSFLHAEGNQFRNEGIAAALSDFRNMIELIGD